MPPLDLYARVRIFFTTAHETAGAACTRLSLRPLSVRGRNEQQSSGESCRENAEMCPMVIASHRSARRADNLPGPIEGPADFGGDGVLPNWRAAADEDGHYVFAVAL